MSYKFNNLMETPEAREAPYSVHKVHHYQRNLSLLPRNIPQSKMKFKLSELPKEKFELAIEPKENEIVVLKTLSRIFIGTNFELMCSKCRH
ncbi:MAG: hypothetical protein BJBARM4_0905 [Candidatus Parvarchaeum acidiphilum ARMAN-4]|uniref:Uncharacterized protein n=1 Tax=Candidatus Parvarchaeum acidiphilum ARMAN-4 TaxID=662760 RepID=D2EGK6_PARA4|nr:MAG: hypothetical protein BJBARM4_0905 [Candidatus Parvarchaeum acidiphilum ARMAN-4]